MLLKNNKAKPIVIIISFIPLLYVFFSSQSFSDKDYLDCLSLLIVYLFGLYLVAAFVFGWNIHMSGFTAKPIEEHRWQRIIAIDNGGCFYDIVSVV